MNNLQIDVFDMLELLTFPHTSKRQLMATCPRCLGPLTDDHRCRRGMLSRIADAVITTGVGALGGWIVILLIDERAASALILAAAALGAVLATAVRQAIHGPIR